MAFGKLERINCMSEYGQNKKIYIAPQQTCRVRRLLSSLPFIIMGRGERDKVDTSLIVTKPRVPRPTARARGLDQQEELSTVPENAKG
jgi:hypothetical protein